MTATQLSIGILAGVVTVACVVVGQNSTCDPGDLKALQNFFDGLEPASRLQPSSPPDCCRWPGVLCSSVSGRVVGLELPRKKIAGPVTESLGLLDQLLTVDLSANFLRGDLPSSLFHLPRLRVLNLASNFFSGVIPPEIDLPSLQFLDLSQNSIAGTIPESLCSSQLRHISLAANNISGTIPNGIRNCSSLTNLSLDDNCITGAFTDGVFGLQQLTHLTVSSNCLAGNLNSRIGNMTGLVNLDVSMNGFTGQLPDVFTNLQNLRFFTATSNSFNGGLPPSMLNSSSLQSVSLRNNSLTGPLLVHCPPTTNLSLLDLGTNRFSGPIPGSFTSCRKLQTINLSRNKISGQIPQSFGNFESLIFFSASNSSLHNISSALEILQRCKSLSSLILTLNFRMEILPSEQSFGFENMRMLVIANCRLSGVIPGWLRSCKNLQLLDLSWNRLTGPVPPWFGDFESLFYADLSNNSLTGKIPKSITQLQALKSRQKVTAMTTTTTCVPFFQKRNQSSKGLQYNRISSFPPTLDMSLNFFAGRIWPEFGNLKALHVLDLKFNNLSGFIPSELSSMTSLETLDLSHNDLSGMIPNSLTNLSFLSSFSVAYNQLSGEIPSSGQFLTFTVSSFQGNNDLCIDHASPCQGYSTLSSGNLRKSKRNRLTVQLPAGVASAVAVFLFISILTCRILRRSGAHTRNRIVDSGNDPEKGRMVVLFQESSKQLVIDDILKATENFDEENIIGCGGFGLVYKAILPDGRTVAIKRLSGECLQLEREFQAEVETLSRAQHRNLVLLQGYCRYNSDRLLMYTYMENGSLDYWLHEKSDGPATLDWEKRFRIARGSIEGLWYLHNACEQNILHRDIKSSNILLDENFEAHLADFGLARLIDPYQTHVTTDLVGTLGYIPPEYGQASVASYKGDVYSLGVVVLELLTGRRPIDMCRPIGLRDMVAWVTEMKKEKREMEVIDTLIYSKAHGGEIEKLLQIACICVNPSPQKRPSTQDLLSWIDRAAPTVNSRQ